MRFFSKISVLNCASEDGDNHSTLTLVKVASIVANLQNQLITFYWRSRGGLSITENCVPACLSCNGHKSDADVFDWYRRQRFRDPRRAMAIRAWMDGDLRLALRLLQWAHLTFNDADRAHGRRHAHDQWTTATGPARWPDHQTRQASAEWCCWQMDACCSGCFRSQGKASLTRAAAATAMTMTGLSLVICRTSLLRLTTRQHGVGMTPKKDMTAHDRMAN